MKFTCLLDFALFDSALLSLSQKYSHVYKSSFHLFGHCPEIYFVEIIFAFYIYIS